MPIFQEDTQEHGAIPYSFNSSGSTSCTLYGRTPPNLCRGIARDGVKMPNTELLDKQHDTNKEIICERVALIQHLKSVNQDNRLSEMETSCSSRTRTPEQLASFSERPVTQPGGTRSSVSRWARPEALQSLTSTKRTTSQENLSAGTEIVRPRSALHSGDFTQQIKPFQQDVFDHSSLYNPPSPSWFATSPPRDFAVCRQDIHTTTSSRSAPIFDPGYRAPSLSSSLSSSFAYKAPTSPLVHSESNDDLDDEMIFAPVETTSEYGSSFRSHMQLHNLVHSSTTPPNYVRPSPSARRNRTSPYQAHQPRRSITLSSCQTAPIAGPQYPASERVPRRPSFSQDNAPSSRTSMVGSYEESILRGRMSTAPSRPLDFVAQIGVLGHGDCKPQLRCPPHAILSFPAVFYSYATTLHGRYHTEDSPSPYVGQIDLENGLKGISKKGVELKERSLGEGDVSPHLLSELYTGDGISKEAARRLITTSDRSRIGDTEKHKSQRAPPGGSYRIPQRGQLQIIIKNPNKTAVKLFLVPYDLEGMQPGTKTFLRQRSYSAGPIVDMPLSAASDLNSVAERPTLRYLIHIHICCTGRNRFYLYKSIRVVFANRVPDGKEKLQNSIQIPDPKYSPYRPDREPVSSMSVTSLAVDKAQRRRSSGYNMRSGSAFVSGFEPHDFPFSFESTKLPVSLQLSSQIRAASSYPAQRDVRRIEQASSHLGFDDVTAYKQELISVSPTCSTSSQSGPGTARARSNNEIDTTSDGGNTWNKLGKGDNGYGRTPSRSGKNVDSSLLSLEFRGLSTVPGDKPFYLPFRK